MHKRGMWAAGLAGAMIVEMGAARAADAPVLVVVETQPGLGVDAADVRRRIASELGAEVVAPSDPAAARAAQVLIVALDEHDIRISMRSGPARVSRAIPDVAERTARLRAVAWLAGNLARDQVGPLLPNLALADSPPRAKTPTEVPAPTPPAPAPTTEPPPLSATSSPAATLQRLETEGTGASPSDSSWAITAVGGAAVSGPCFRDSVCATTGYYVDSAYQLDLEYQRSRDALIIGGGIDSGPAPHLIGVAGFVGRRRRWHGLLVEGTIGGGVEFALLPHETSSVTNSNQSGVISQTTLTFDTQPALYGRAVASIGLPISRSLDLIARSGLHVASSGLSTDLLSASIGLRYEL